jgi:hypothetical protein
VVAGVRLARRNGVSPAQWLARAPVVGRDVVEGLLDVEGAGPVVQAHKEVLRLLTEGIDGLAAWRNFHAADFVSIYLLEGYGDVRECRLANRGVEEVGEPVLEEVTRAEYELRRTPSTRSSSQNAQKAKFAEIIFQNLGE